jgi:hypothetical protein
MIRRFLIAFALMLAFLVIENDLAELFGATPNSIFRTKTKASLYFGSALFAIAVSIGKQKSKNTSKQTA